MQISAKADYAVRAAIELAVADGRIVRSEDIATAQAIPQMFLVKILHELRLAGVVRSQRGPEGGHQLTLPADQVSVADILRAIEGPLAEVRGTAPEDLAYSGTAVPLQRVWIALRTNVAAVLESVTLEDLARGSLPAGVDTLADEGESPVAH